MKGYQDILYEVNAPSAIITLNRPDQLNAFTLHTLKEIRHAVESAADDPAVVGIILTGTGRGFSAGLDMAALAAATQNTTDESVVPVALDPEADLPGIFSYFMRIPKPIIAAVNGVAAGGGFILALLSDMRFASADTVLTTVFLKRGLIAEHGSSWLLPRLVGVSKALDLLWMSDKISAAQALDLGLVDRVFAASDLLVEAQQYVTRLSKISAPQAIAATKRMVYDHLGTSYELALHDADRMQTKFVVAPDAKEGAAAFMERRSPQFAPVGEANEEADKR